MEEPRLTFNATHLQSISLRHKVKCVADVRVLMGHSTSALRPEHPNQQFANPDVGNVRFTDDSEYCCYVWRWPGADSLRRNIGSMPKELFPFRYRDVLTGKWVRAHECRLNATHCGVLYVSRG